jgi:hypothetical protein
MSVRVVKLRHDGEEIQSNGVVNYGKWAESWGKYRRPEPDSFEFMPLSFDFAANTRECSHIT